MTHSKENRSTSIRAWFTACLLFSFTPLGATADLSRAAREAIDKKVAEVLKDTGTPGVSLAVVKDGAIVYSKAYGIARQGTPQMPVTETMRFKIGSVSKQFTAAAVLLLAEDGKLSLDDPVARWLPELTRAKDVTIRQLLSHTAGYSDYWPQEYLFQSMLMPITPEAILDGWAKRPLDFEPGTKQQYSNTGYVVAGLIAEKAAGQPLFDFLKARVFEPLGMTSVADVNSAPLRQSDPAGYFRFVSGPTRPAPSEGKGWLFAAGGLAMNAIDLAKWDISLMAGTIITPASHREMETVVRLTNGLPTNYGLGIWLGASTTDGRRYLSHNGAVSGFTSLNWVYPDDKAAVVVLVNFDVTDAPDRIATRVRERLFPSPEKDREEATLQAKKIFESLQTGTIDRTLFSVNANAYFSPEALRDYESSLKILGAPKSFTQTRQNLRGGMTFRQFKVAFEKKIFEINTLTLSDGKLEQYKVMLSE